MSSSATPAAGRPAAWPASAARPPRGTSRGRASGSRRRRAPTWMCSAPAPSAPRTIGPIRPAPSVRSSTTAPAPSANTAAVARSSGSVIRDIRSAPITTTHRARPASICAGADRQRRQEARAGRADVERAGPGRAERVGHQRRGAGHQLVGGGRGDDHQVDVERVDPGAMPAPGARSGWRGRPAARRARRSGASGSRCAARSSRPRRRAGRRSRRWRPPGRAR